MSPNHARNVALVLSLKTGLASPQFHVVFDSKFETMRRRFGEEETPRSYWQSKCHFIGQAGKRVSLQLPSTENARNPSPRSSPDRSREEEDRAGVVDEVDTDEVDFNEGPDEQGGSSTPTLEESNVPLHDHSNSDPSALEPATESISRYGRRGRSHSA